MDRLSEIAKKRGVQNAQIALAWILSKPGVGSLRTRSTSTSLAANAQGTPDAVSDALRSNHFGKD
jgi:aryl-alcohol dehydrogenase-like predicted oxidoreductase